MLPDTAVDRRTVPIGMTIIIINHDAFGRTQIPSEENEDNYHHYQVEKKV